MSSLNTRLRRISELFRPLAYRRTLADRAFRPVVEVLEGRRVPALLVVNSALDNTTDTSHLTLRDAITLVDNGGNPSSLGQSAMPAGWASQLTGTFGSNDTIQFDPGLSGSTITLDGSALPTINSNVTITGLGPTRLAISGGNQSEVFNIGSVTAALSGLSIIDGNGVFGGGLYSQGTLSLTDTLFSGNLGLYGGAVYTRNGTLTVKNDEFDDNTASVESGAIDNWAGGTVIATNDTFDGNSAEYGGGIGNEWGNVVVSNSTFTGNQASAGDGGAIVNFNPNDVAYFSNSLTVSDSTITGNSAADGGGIANAGKQPFTLQNTILSGNSAPNNPDVAGEITDNKGFNVLGKALAHTASGPGDVFSDSPRLARLGYYGGVTQTMPLLPNSPARGTGNVKAIGLPPTDQRGFVRVVNGRTDIGAFQTQALPYLVDTAADTASGTDVPEGMSLRDAIDLADALAPAGGASIGFAIPTSDPGYNVATGVFTIAASAPMPLIAVGLTIDGTTQFGYAGTPVVQLDGANAGSGANGLTISANHSTIRGLVITGFGGDGIAVYGSDNRIEGDYIGVRADGLSPQGNNIGVLIQTGTDNTVGGTTTAARNVISGNAADGVDITGYGTTGNVVEGNFIGTTNSGAVALGNGGDGVTIYGEASDNTIGGDAAGAGNVISGNEYQGIGIYNVGTNDNWVVGNDIGTNPGGTTATGTNGMPLGNGIYHGSSGIYLDYGVQYNQVRGNVISGNELAGISIANTYAEGTANNVISGNKIGTNAAGTAALANGIGIYAFGGTDDTIGGLTAADRNLISGNTSAGVEISGVGTNDNKIEGNSIGIGRSSAIALGNGGDGIEIIAGASDNTVGGTAAGSGNDIAHNAEGVAVGDSPTDSQTLGNRILGNSIWDNSGLGIELGDNDDPFYGVVTSQGPNHWQPAPSLFEASGRYISGELFAAPDTRYRIEFFATPESDGTYQGQVFLGWQDVTTDANGFVSIKAVLADPKGTVVTATATNLATGDTSEFAE